MKKNILFTIITSLFFSTLIAQNNSPNGSGPTQTQPLNKEKTMRLRLGAGISQSSIANQMEVHLIQAGFGDKVNAKLDWLKDNGNDFYPQKHTIPFVAELALEYKVGKKVWAGLSVGMDEATEVEGYDRYGTKYSLWNGTYSFGQFLKIEHRSWFFSPQLSLDSRNEKITFFGGPTLDFHSLGIAWKGEKLLRDRPKKIGALVGIRANITDNFKWFATYRFSKAVTYTGTSADFTFDEKTYTSTLPTNEISISHFRTGFAVDISW